MIKYKKKKIETLQMVSITCDLCGKTFGKISDENIYEIQEFICIDTRGGYGSIIGDEEEIKLDICQHCFKSIYDKKIK